MATLSIHLDWLRATFPYLEDNTQDWNLRRARPTNQLFDFTGETFPAGQGYNNGRRLGAGAVFWHSERPEQGVGLQLSGKDLQACRTASITDEALLEFCLLNNGTMSTLHACINVHDAHANPGDVLAAHERGELQTRAKRVGSYVSQTKVGDEWLQAVSAYIGSPQSAVQIVVYDKAVEQHIHGDWTRIEIRFHGKYAAAAASAMVGQGIAEVTRAAIRKQMSFSAEWWRYAMHGDTSLPTMTTKKERDTIGWLKNVVLRVLEREIKSERERLSDTLYELYAGFIARMKN